MALSFFARAEAPAQPFKQTTMQFEVCANSFTSAKNAQEAGAHRIELCAELGVGGVTPSFGLIKKVCDELTIKVNVLIRPRSGNFVYSADELDIILRDIHLAVELGVNGIVCGSLHEDRSINEKQLEAMLKASSGVEFTFHRAFDLTPDPIAAYDLLATRRIDRILSSGQQQKAIDGLPLLSQLNERGSVRMMPGSGVNAANIKTFVSNGFKEVHFSGTVMSAEPSTAPKIPFITQGLLAEYGYPTSDLIRLKEIIASAESN